MDNDDIPPLTPADQVPPVRTQRDLYRHWRTLLGPLGFGQRMLWLNFLESDGRPTPHLTQIEKVPPSPDQVLLANLVEMCHRVLTESVLGGSLAILILRPGAGQITECDRAWARSLTTAARRADVTLEPVHLATDERVCAFAPDDLLPTAPRSA